MKLFRSYTINRSNYFDFELCSLTFYDYCRSNMSGDAGWNNQVSESLKNFDLNSPEVKEQFGMSEVCSFLAI